MAGAVEPVVGEARRIAVMTAEAFLGAGDRLLGRIEPGGDVLRMRGPGNVDAEPARCAAVAGLAIDAVGELELRAAQALGNVVGVAVEAEFLVGGVGQAQSPRYFDRPVLQQHVVGVAVLVLLRPDQVLVARHRGVARPLRRAVAVTPGAGRDAEMDAERFALRQRRHRGREQQDRGDEQSRMPAGAEDVAGLQIAVEHRVGLGADPGDPRAPNVDVGANRVGAAARQFEAEGRAGEAPAPLGRRRVGVEAGVPGAYQRPPVGPQIGLEHDPRELAAARHAGVARHEGDRAQGVADKLARRHRQWLGGRRATGENAKPQRDEGLAGSFHGFAQRPLTPHARVDDPTGETHFKST